MALIQAVTVLMSSLLRPMLQLGCNDPELLLAMSEALCKRQWWKEGPELQMDVHRMVHMLPWRA